MINTISLSTHGIMDGVLGEHGRHDAFIREGAKLPLSSYPDARKRCNIRCCFSVANLRAVLCGAFGHALIDYVTVVHPFPSHGDIADIDMDTTVTRRVKWTLVCDYIEQWTVSEKKRFPSAATLFDVLGIDHLGAEFSTD